MKEIVLAFEDADFDLLTTAWSFWKGGGWEASDGLFDVRHSGEHIRYDLRVAYWFDNAANYLLAREYLRSQHARYQELQDNGMPSPCGHPEHRLSPSLGSYILITDFMSPDVARHKDCDPARCDHTGERCE